MYLFFLIIVFIYDSNKTRDSLLSNGSTRKRYVYIKPVTLNLQGIFRMNIDKTKWLKSRGYIHIIPKVDIYRKQKEYVSKLENPIFVAKHSFFPLIHYKIKERKYKRHPIDPKLRVHSFKNEREKTEQTAKYRPIHFATHLDAMIFAYYSELLSHKYSLLLEKYPPLKDSITAYRKMPIDDSPESKGKSTIHFAKEAFDEIKARSQSPCSVLMFDIKSFFSELDHTHLKNMWKKALDISGKLEDDHFNVFNATTNFSYVLRDDLRLFKPRLGEKRSGFDEKALAKNRKFYGVESYFHSVDEFRKALKDRTLKVYKRQFMKNGIPVGIPQGLPISSVLANLYLYNFDVAIYEQVVKQKKGFYRRYSDDILIICKPEEIVEVEDIVKKEIEKCNLRLSENKTETYLFKQNSFGNQGSRLTSFEVYKDGTEKIKPLSYLGFQFYGYQARIKSANLAKFYRKTIDSVKRKTRRIRRVIATRPYEIPYIQINQVKKLSTSIKKNTVLKKVNVKHLRLSQLGIHQYKIKPVDPKHRSNYISYVRRVSAIFDDPKIYRQINKRKTILHKALEVHHKRIFHKFH